MGARPYDPNLGRFLATDPIETAAHSTTTTTPAKTPSTATTSTERPC
jgi:hypothetical protein